MRSVTTSVLVLFFWLPTVGFAQESAVFFSFNPGSESRGLVIPSLGFQMSLDADQVAPVVSVSLASVVLYNELTVGAGLAVPIKEFATVVTVQGAVGGYFRPAFAVNPSSRGLVLSGGLDSQFKVLLGSLPLLPHVGVVFGSRISEKDAFWRIPVGLGLKL